MEREILLRKLEDNLQKARVWREQAAANFDAAIQLALAPDRHARLAAASKEYSRALEAVNIALKEYNDYAMFKKEPASITPIRRENAG